MTVSRAFGITPEYVRSLAIPDILVQDLFYAKLREHGADQAARVSDRKTAGAGGVLELKPENVVDRVAMQPVIRELGLERDDDMVELYLLGIMSRMNIADGGFMTVGMRCVADGVTGRVHDLIEKRPELLHPKLQVARNLADGTYDFLRFLVSSGVQLDPQRLAKMSATPGVGQEMLELSLAHLRRVGAELYTYALKVPLGGARSAHALLRAGNNADAIDEHEVDEISRMCGAAAAASEWQYQETLELLREIRRQQDARGGDGFRLSWPGTTEDILEAADFAWASSRGAHPIMTFIYELGVFSASTAVNRTATVEGFPGRPLAEVTQLLNDILEPQYRMPLETISGVNLLKLTTLCPSACQNMCYERYFNLDDSAASRRMPNSPDHLLEWVVDHPHATSLEVSDFDLLEDRLRVSVGHERLSKLRARVVERAMDAVIGGIPYSKPTAQARRRARAV